MRELNVDFLEQYKQLDKLCKDMYSSGEGVSSYIKDMESASCSEKQCVYNWDAIYKQLKHIRWLRNQLAHEIDINTDFCDQNDIDWVKQFYKSIFNGNDPLAIARQSKQQVGTRTTKLDSTIVKSNNAVKEKPRKSLWSRFASKIKNLFS